jgi:hypothetical protein
MMKRKPRERKRPTRPSLQRRRKPALTWLTTWRRLLHRSTFGNLDELQAFLEEEGVHSGEVPTAEAFRRGIAKQHRGKFFWHLAKCTQLLKRHGKYEEINKDDYEVED